MILARRRSTRRLPGEGAVTAPCDADHVALDGEVDIFLTDTGKIETNEEVVTPPVGLHAPRPRHPAADHHLLGGPVESVPGDFPHLAPQLITAVERSAAKATGPDDEADPDPRSR